MGTVSAIGPETPGGTGKTLGSVCKGAHLGKNVRNPTNCERSLPCSCVQPSAAASPSSTALRPWSPKGSQPRSRSRTEPLAGQRVNGAPLVGAPSRVHLGTSTLARLSGSSRQGRTPCSASTSAGSCGSSGPTRPSRCRCGPVTFPVDPTVPLTLPASTSWPGATLVSFWWEYQNLVPSGPVDRKSVVDGKLVSDTVDLGARGPLTQ